jgi:hypothetical protein
MFPFPCAVLSMSLTVSQFKQSEDVRAKRYNVDALFKTNNCWGEVRGLLSYEWEGETRCLAFIHPAKVKESWSPGKAAEGGPQLLHRPPGKPSIQIVDLKAVTSVAGRVSRAGNSGKVIFDIANGMLDPNEYY